MSESINPDLNGTQCTATDCLQVADVIGAATVTVPLELGFTDAENTVVLDLPLCIDHAHRLRGGVTSCRVDSFRS